MEKIGELESNNIYCIDCLVGLKRIPDNSIDFILTDPPFNVDIDYGENHDDEIDDEEYYKWCYEWIKDLYRVLKEGRYCIIFSGDKKICYVMKAIYATPFKFHHFLKWYKPNCQRGLPGTVFLNKTELAFILSKGKPDITTINRKVMPLDTVKHNNWTEDRKELEISFSHPAGRPTPLYRQIISGFTNEGEIVLDSFMGSGTTAVACKQLNRRFIGFDINPDYIKIANKRLAQEILERPWTKIFR